MLTLAIKISIVVRINDCQLKTHVIVSTCAVGVEEEIDTRLQYCSRTSNEHVLCDSNFSLLTKNMFVIRHYSDNKGHGLIPIAASLVKYASTIF